MKTNNLKGTLILGVAAFIWGMAFVAQNMVSDTIPSFTVNACRSFIAAIFLYIFWKITTRNKKTTFFPTDKALRKKYYISGIVCGCCLTVASNLQQFGIAMYPENAPTEAHAGFLTALYVILVPIFSVFLRKKVGLLVGVGGLIAAVGIYLLCFSGGMGGFYTGDIVLFACAIAFTFHILSVDKYVSVTGGVKLSILQFFVVGVLSLVGALIFDIKTVTLHNLIDGALPILYLGIMSSGVAYTLQIVGQKYAQPAVASITMSFESVFAVLGGVLFSSGHLTTHEILGCIVMFVAIIVAQIPELLQSKNA
jgi:drug/metabolite transporter (DMT)-like permease